MYADRLYGVSARRSNRIVYNVKDQTFIDTSRVKRYLRAQNTNDLFWQTVSPSSILSPYRLGGQLRTRNVYEQHHCDLLGRLLGMLRIYLKFTLI